MHLQAILFDAYGTLFDVHSVTARAEALFPGQGTALSAAWRDKQIEYTRLVTMSEGPAGSATGSTAAGQSSLYQPFSVLTRAALRHAAARLALSLDAAGEDTLMAEYQQLRPFPENLGVLQALAARGVPCGILSNGDPGMLNAVVAHAGFTTLLRHVLSVDSVRRYKTDPAAYAVGPTAFGLSAGEILFVSSNAWDALGATWYGYTTLWINRAGAPAETLGPPPTHTGHSLQDVLALFPG